MTNQAPPTGAPPKKPAKPASMATYKRELRKEIKRRAVEPEINFLNITAMLDMMTIILVFLLKSMSAMSTMAAPATAAETTMTISLRRSIPVLSSNSEKLI